MTRLTPELLRAATGCSLESADRFAHWLDEACVAHQIDTPARLAAFLAQIGHESGSLRCVAELWGPTPAQQRYEGRKDLGNTEPGDGSRYRGRGLIQITGRANYAELSAAAGVDFVAQPELLESAQWAAWSAARFWHTRSLNALADAGNFDAITKRINGGLNGKEDRDRRHAVAKAAFSLPAAPVAAPAPAPETAAAAPVDQYAQENAPMLPFLLPALQAVIGIAPELGKIFGSGSEVSDRNIKAAELVVGAAKEALGVKNEQELVETIKSDPVAAQTVREAVQANWWKLEEIGGGVAAARSFNVQQSNIDPKRNMALWVTGALLPLVYLVVSRVIFSDSETFSQDVKAMTVAAVISGVLGAITGYWLGTSFSSAKKDDAKAQGAQP